MSRPLNVAVLGLGFMGVTHLKAWSQVPDVRVSAVVDADPRKLTGDLSGVGGILGGGGRQFDFSGVRACATLTEALADPALDAVDICLPTDEHAPAATAALRAGKHVLTEKPMALDSAAAEALIRKAEQSGKLLMAAHVLRFFPAYEALAESVRGNAVRSALFRRRCAAPVWSAWLKDPARSGGAVMDLLIHDADYCISLWGMPEAVRARGFRDLGRGIDVIHADLIYPGMGPVVITGGWHHPGHYPFSMEFSVTTDEATFDWVSGTNELRVYPAEGDPKPVALPEKDAFAAELAYFADCAANNRQPDRCPPVQSAQAVRLIEAILQSRDRQGTVSKC